MNAREFIVNVNSRRPERLIDFYKDVVGLTPQFEVTPGAFMAGSSGFVSLIIEEHDELQGPALEPQRMLLNFVVEDATSEQRRLQEQGVEFLRTAYEEPGVGIFATFLDPDGNYCQLIELRG